ncbi:MAG TPA: sarcosine oxidase subunit gamma family protein [Xanthobacteraceae bacterium]|nr:sarcosine oxidase subunit gamma family protein [Xanthobacteraceae bacterium]
MADLLASIPPGARLPRARYGAAAGPPGVVVRERACTVATVAARRGRAAACVAQLAALTGTAALDSPNAVTAGDVMLIGTAPGRWSVLAAAGVDLEARLAPGLAGLASVVDQSGGVVAFELAGPAMDALLAGLVSIDLDPSVFPPGAAATTTLAYIGVTLWQAPAGHWTFLVGRSFAPAFERTVAASAARFGVAFE